MIFTFSVVSIFFAWLTYTLIKKTQMTPTRVSSGLTLVAIITSTLIAIFLPVDASETVTLIFGATFVGMCSHKNFTDIEIIAAALIYSLIYTKLRPAQYGVGGALGFSAFTSILIVWCSQKLKQFFHIKEDLLT